LRKPQTAPPTSASAAEVAAVEWQRIADQLERLVIGVAAAPSVATPTATTMIEDATAPRQPVPLGEVDPQLYTRLATLEREVRSMRGRVNSPAVSKLAHTRPSATNWKVLREIVDGFHGTEEMATAARQRVMLRTPEQILEMFGMPTSSEVDQAGRMVWSYYQSGGPGLSVSFVDGLAMM